MVNSNCVESAVSLPDGTFPPFVFVAAINVVTSQVIKGDKAVSGVEIRGQIKEIYICPRPLGPAPKVNNANGAFSSFAFRPAFAQDASKADII